MKKVLLVLITLLLQVPAFATPIDVIYGEDDRNDVYAARDAVLRDLAKSTAAMIAPANLKASAGRKVEVIAQSLVDRGICASERFSDQPSAARCSGFLVGDNLLVTAGHCIRTEADCKNFRWVFDYRMSHEGQVKISIPVSSVYSCKKIITTAENSSGEDHALIELNRKVTGRKPLNFRKSGRISVGDDIAVIGHPTGLPTKITDGAKVRSLKGTFFVANLDTYGGNSGSAVFNLKTAEVEGILVRGETDYINDPVRKCKVSNRCSDTGCRGEDVTYISNIKELKNIR